MRRLPILLLFTAVALVSLSACGRDREFKPPAPLGPEAYVIAEKDLPREGQFVRYQESTEDQFGGLDVSITEYVPEVEGSGPTMVLLGVVHIGDERYYQALQEELDACDVVLYEAIKPPGISVADWWTDAAADDGREASLQARVAKWFGMVYQLGALDYSHPRFVHADMTVDEFLERGGDEVVPGIGSEDGNPEEVDEAMEMVTSLGDLVLGTPGPLRSLARNALARALGMVDVVQTIEMYPEMEDLILTQRNEFAWEIAKPYLKRPANERVAIFYGAAHNKGLEEMLEDAGYVRSKARWVRAWALRKPFRD